MTSKYCTITILLLCLLVLSACSVAGNPIYTPETPAGFWQGMWHGMISWIALIVRAFGGDWAVYEVANNGGFYDWGFLMGAGGSSCTCAGGAVSRRRRE